MTAYYIAREVKPGSPASYPSGRTFLNDESTFTSSRQAQVIADCFNNHCNVRGVNYLVVSCDDSDPNALTTTGCDRFSRP